MLGRSSPSLQRRFQDGEREERKHTFVCFVFRSRSALWISSQTASIASENAEVFSVKSRAQSPSKFTMDI